MAVKEKGQELIKPAVMTVKENGQVIRICHCTGNICMSRITSELTYMMLCNDLAMWRHNIHGLVQVTCLSSSSGSRQNSNVVNIIVRYTRSSVTQTNSIQQCCLELSNNLTCWVHFTAVNIHGILLCVKHKFQLTPVSLYQVDLRRARFTHLQQFHACCLTTLP